jgi:hypothetical protein
VKVIRLEGDPRPFELCVARHGKYAVVPVILDWERHAGFFVNRARAKVSLSLMPPQGGKPLRTVDLAMKDARPNVLLVSPPVLPPEQLDEAVRRLLSQ